MGRSGVSQQLTQPHSSSPSRPTLFDSAIEYKTTQKPPQTSLMRPIRTTGHMMPDEGVSNNLYGHLVYQVNVPEYPAMTDNHNENSLITLLFYRQHRCGKASRRPSYDLIWSIFLPSAPNAIFCLVPLISAYSGMDPARLIIKANKQYESSARHP